MSNESSQHKSRVIAIAGVRNLFAHHLLRQLPQSPGVEKVIAIDVAPLSAQEPQVPKHSAIVPAHIDLTHPSSDGRLASLLQDEGVDTLVHLAFLKQPVFDTVWAHELESIGTMHILNACAAVQIPKLVVRSTTAVYGPMPRHPNFIKETHALYPAKTIQFVADKVDAEQQIAKFAQWNRDTEVTVLRFCPIIGPNSTDFVMGYLSQLFPLRLMGRDPLIQLLYEDDAVAAMKIALFGSHPGVFHIAPGDVLPIRTVLRAFHRRGVTLPLSVASPLLNTLWIFKLRNFPPGFLDFLRYLCVVDNNKARQILGFVPELSTRQALHRYREHTGGGGLLRPVGHPGNTLWRRRTGV